MSHNTELKVEPSAARQGEQGQKQLASGERIAMRLWEEGPVSNKAPSTRNYETVGYVLEGHAILRLNGEDHVHLNPGDSWVVPKGATHTYEIKDRFKAVEAITK